MAFLEEKRRVERREKKKIKIKFGNRNTDLKKPPKRPYYQNSAINPKNRPPLVGNGHIGDHLTSNLTTGSQIM